ncbi:MAG: ATP-binding cassette domain-containing protein, partial [Sulfolobales archaeon]
PPGSGKSTLMKLVMRFYDPDEGAILLDGVDVRNLKLSTIRNNVGYVPQEPFIFNGTIYDNVVLGNPSATFEDVVRATEVAKIRKFIESLPRGFNMIVGERGIDLSGGQRQRIAIARALVRNPKILLLDDPVANLDAETEKALVEDLKEILKNRTAIIVTQRLSLVPLADRIVVMNDGEIVEEGTHEELMRKRGMYYRMYISMMGESNESAN